MISPFSICHLYCSMPSDPGAPSMKTALDADGSHNEHITNVERRALSKRMAGCIKTMFYKTPVTHTDYERLWKSLNTSKETGVREPVAESNHHRVMFTCAVFVSGPAFVFPEVVL